MVYIGIVEKKMENIIMGYIRFLGGLRVDWGLYRDSGKENGN